MLVVAISVLNSVYCRIIVAIVNTCHHQHTPDPFSNPPPLEEVTHTRTHTGSLHIKITKK